MAYTTLVDTGQLEKHLSSWRLFDCRHDLDRPQLGEQQYHEAHIPGAAFAHLDRDLSAPKSGGNGRHPLPDRGAFVAWLGQRGLKPGDQVVCYDGGSSAMAARLWWMLRWVGHEAVAVLDGGLAKWLHEGRPTTHEVTRFARSSYPVRPPAAQAVDVALVEREGAKLLLLDARAPARFRGEHEPIDPIAGRIPGAKNRFSDDNLGPQGIFKKPELLRDEFRAVLGDRAAEDVVSYCGSGVTACHNLLAMELAGLRGGKLYAGSWSEWIADPARAREKG